MKIGKNFGTATPDEIKKAKENLSIIAQRYYLREFIKHEENLGSLNKD